MIARQATVACAVAVAIAAAGCTTAVPGSAVAAPGAASVTPRPSVSGTPTARPVPVVINPVVPGWVPVRSVNRAAAYDVPPEWKLFGEGVIVGFEDPVTFKPRVASTGVAQLESGRCAEERPVARAVLRHDTGSDLGAAALNNAAAWANATFRDDRDGEPRLTPHPPEAITTLTGQQATVVKVDAAFAGPQTSCPARSGAAYAVSAGGYRGELGPVVVLVVLTFVGVPAEPSDAQVRQILTSLRPATAK